MENITFKQIRNHSEDKAREFLETIRWNGKTVCPHCNNEEAYILTSKPVSKTRKGVYFAKRAESSLVSPLAQSLKAHASRLLTGSWWFTLWLHLRKVISVTSYTAHLNIGGKGLMPVCIPKTDVFRYNSTQDKMMKNWKSDPDFWNQ